MNHILPDRYALVAGCGHAETDLNAFDRALVNAGAGDLNLVKVTSILPPHACQGDVSVIPRGAVVFTAIGSKVSSQEKATISAAVAVGIPKDPGRPGVLMEGSFSLPPEEAEQRVRAMAQTAMDDRGTEVDRIESIAAGCETKSNSAAFAAVLLWVSD